MLQALRTDLSGKQMDLVLIQEEESKMDPRYDDHDSDHFVGQHCRLDIAYYGTANGPWQLDNHQYGYVKTGKIYFLEPPPSGPM